ncbi:hypothetical protein POVCU2_0074830 [Plasmodium ovale curtisi]|uniref:Uncharacterized protein n=1 Tax=Plasmodium ovale curtisi TaxID=864141 RepID=A0A1A8WL14_PLAOA|nr:hypothetical protein POVCU2_0074830 [Plasmodium ovale curtisi]SBS99205.1 hypothetical protein POVCU1_051300 [Plasmodium ovale curtisi]
MDFNKLKLFENISADGEISITTGNDTRYSDESNRYEEDRTITNLLLEESKDKMEQETKGKVEDGAASQGTLSVENNGIRTDKNEEKNANVEVPLKKNGKAKKKNKRKHSESDHADDDNNKRVRFSLSDTETIGNNELSEGRNSYSSNGNNTETHLNSDMNSSERSNSFYRRNLLQRRRMMQRLLWLCKINTEIQTVVINRNILLYIKNMFYEKIVSYIKGCYSEDILHSEGSSYVDDILLGDDFSPREGGPLIPMNHIEIWIKEARKNYVAVRSQKIEITPLMRNNEGDKKYNVKSQIVEIIPLIPTSYVNVTTPLIPDDEISKLSEHVLRKQFILTVQILEMSTLIPHTKIAVKSIRYKMNPLNASAEEIERDSLIPNRRIIEWIQECGRVQSVERLHTTGCFHTF